MLAAMKEFEGTTWFIARPPPVAVGRGAVAVGASFARVSHDGLSFLLAPLPFQTIFLPPLLGA